MRASYASTGRKEKGRRLCVVKGRREMGERRHGENITTANGLFEGFEKV